MSTLVQFTPSTNQAFNFQATLGGTPCNVTVLWNVSGQRYYVQVADLSGNVLLFRPMSASGPVLQAQFTWALGTATAVTALPHNVPIGSVANAYASKTESGFDGQYQLLATGANTLTYPLATNPNEPGPVAGNVSFALNLTQGYNLGYLLYHLETQQIEYG